MMEPKKWKKRKLVHSLSWYRELQPQLMHCLLGLRLRSTILLWHWRAAPVRVDYYDMQGLRIEKPAQGMLVIERAVYEDGTVTTTKKIMP